MVNPLRKVLLVILLTAALLVPVKATTDDWTTVAAKALQSIVYIESTEGSCTGFVIDTQRKYVMTAAHCDAPEPIFVDRVVATIVSKDTKQDLAVFEVKKLDNNYLALKLAAKNPEIGQEVLSVGFGMGLERPLVRKAMVSDNALTIPDIGGPFIALDATFVGGQSGGPVVNRDGDVVMIVQRGSTAVGIGVGAHTIRDRMGRFFAPEK